MKKYQNKIISIVLIGFILGGVYLWEGKTAHVADGEMSTTAQRPEVAEKEIGERYDDISEAQAKQEVSASHNQEESNKISTSYSEAERKESASYSKTESKVSEKIDAERSEANSKTSEKISSEQNKADSKVSEKISTEQNKADSKVSEKISSEQNKADSKVSEKVSTEQNKTDSSKVSEKISTEQNEPDSKLVEKVGHKESQLSSGKEKEETPVESDSSKQEMICTLSINVQTVLHNMEKLDPNKKELIPSDGMLLKPVTVTFSKGESVFNALMRACKQNKIHLEYVNTPVYNTAYIEGIGNLYEFDCGELSGWMYKVNGKFPQYGASLYKLQPKDRVEWIYTCDLGADIGGNGKWQVEGNE